MHYINALLRIKVNNCIILGIIYETNLSLNHLCIIYCNKFVHEAQLKSIALATSRLQVLQFVCLLGNVSLCIWQTLLPKVTSNALKANVFTNDLDEFVLLMFHDWLLGGCACSCFFCYAVSKVFQSVLVDCLCMLCKRVKLFSFICVRL